MRYYRRRCHGKFSLLEDGKDGKDGEESKPALDPFSGHRLNLKLAPIARSYRLSPKVGKVRTLIHWMNLYRPEAEGQKSSGTLAETRRRPTFAQMAFKVCEMLQKKSEGKKGCRVCQAVESKRASLRAMASFLRIKDTDSTLMGKPSATLSKTNVNQVAAGKKTRQDKATGSGLSAIEETAGTTHGPALATSSKSFTSLGTQGISYDIFR